MDHGRQAIQQELMAHNPSFRDLVSQHSQLESQLQQLQTRPFLNDQEEVDEVRLKKLKLHIKDEMEAMIRSETMRMLHPIAS